MTADELEHQLVTAGVRRDWTSLAVALQATRSIARTQHVLGPEWTRAATAYFFARIVEITRGSNPVLAAEMISWAA